MVTRETLKAIGGGLAGLALGLALVALGYGLGGRGESTGAFVLAGTIVVVGLSVALVSVFMLLLPPLLPSR